MGVASKWMTCKGVDSFRWAEEAADFCATSRIEIDADGAPNAYGPSNTGPGGTNPRNRAGAPTGHLQYVIFPESRRTPSWPPPTADDIDALAAARLDQLRGSGAIS